MRLQQRGTDASFGDLQKFLSYWEDELRPQLDRATLALEADLGVEAANRLYQPLGAMFDRTRTGYGLTPREVIWTYPAVTMTTLVGHATTGYRQGAFWDEYWARLGLGRSQQFENEIRTAVPRIFDRLRLEPFAEQSRIVDRILLHAGVPDYCMRDLVTAIFEHLKRGNSDTGQAVVDWLLEPNKAHRIRVLDKPVQLFIQQGGAYAIDTVDRIVSVVVEKLDNPEKWGEQVEVLRETVGLPSMMFDGLVRALEERELAPLRKTARVGFAQRPHIALDMVDDELQLILPVYGRGTRWKVSLDGDVLVPACGGSVTDTVAVLIDRPARRIIASEETTGRTYEWHLVNNEDPLLVFTDRGRLLGRGEAIPRGVVFLAVPGDTTVVDAAGAPVRSIDLGSPAGWLDWCLLQVDTEDLESVRITRNGAVHGRTRLLRRNRLPELYTGDYIRGLKAGAGQPVLAERPTVLLPASPGSIGRRWKTMWRESGTLSWNVAQFECAEVDQIAQPFENADGPMLGTFELVVRGPLGSDSRYVVTVAEGLELNYTVDFRTPVHDGLTDVSLTVTAPKGMDCDAYVLDFARNELSKELTVQCATKTVTFVVKPPHVEMRLDQRGERARWLTVPPMVSPQALADGEWTLAYRVPATSDLDTWLELRDSRDVTRLTDSPDYREHSDAFEYPAARLSSTAIDCRSSRVVAVVRREGETDQQLTIAHVRPDKLFRSVDPKDGRLYFTDLVDTEGLQVQIWSDTAPWRKAAVVPVLQCSAEIPAQLRGAGPLLVRVVVDDPWVPSETPEWPPEDAIRITQPGWMRDNDKTLDNLARFLADEGGLPFDSEPRSETWTAYYCTLTGFQHEGYEWLRTTLPMLLRRDPLKSLRELSASNVPQDAFPHLIVRSGLVKCRYINGADVAAAPNPWVACMALLDLLPRLEFGSSIWRQVVSELSSLGGRDLLGTLFDGPHQELAQARFNADTVVMHEWSPERCAAAVSAARVVPGALLDADTRTLAVFQAFTARNQWAERPECSKLNEATPQLMTAVRSTDRMLSRQIQVRHQGRDGHLLDDYAWGLMPYQSLLLATLARLEAHGLIRDGIDAELLRIWAEFARLCPRLVELDLLIAEATVQQTIHGNLVGDMYAS